MRERGYLAAVLLLAVSLIWGCQGPPPPAARRTGSGDSPAHFYVGLPSPEEQQAVKALVLSLTPEQVRKANAWTKSSPEGLPRFDQGKGLPYAELTQQQKEAVEVLWARVEQRAHSFLERKPHLREMPGLVPGPVEQAEIFNVGYYLIPEETKEHTLLSFLCASFPTAVPMETTLSGVIELTPGLEAEGLDVSKYCVITREPERLRPEARARFEKAVQEGMAGKTE